MRYRLRTLLTQFSIRDLLWLIAVAAMAASLFRERAAMKADIARLVTAQQIVGNLEATFRAFDTNRDGNLHWGEYSAGTGCRCIDATRFITLDKNSVGLLSFNE